MLVLSSVPQYYRRKATCSPQTVIMPQISLASETSLSNKCQWTARFSSNEQTIEIYVFECNKNLRILGSGFVIIKEIYVGSDEIKSQRVMSKYKTIFCGLKVTVHVYG